MREILFRSKRNDNGEWVYGDLMHKHYNFDTKATKVIHNNIMNYKVIPETVGQYTGLTDKNGKKIFEGDIIKQNSPYRDIFSVIEYGVGYAYSNVYGVCQRFRDESGTSLLSVADESGKVYCEVIGNIHDNPELLKGGAE